MASYTGSNPDEEDLALASRSLQLSSDASDEDIPQLHHTGSAPPSPVPHPNTLEQNNLALASSMAQQSPDAAGEQVRGSSLASTDANQITPQYKYSEDNGEPVLALSELPADMYNEQGGEIGRRRVSSVMELNNTASLPAAMSRAEV